MIPLISAMSGWLSLRRNLVIFLIAGMAADRFDRRLILALCNLVHLIAMALLFSLLWSENGGIPAILSILVLHGTARAFFHTAGQAILPNLVAASLFPKAVAYASVGNKMAQLVGPALGGATIAWAGNADAAFLTALAMFGVAAISAALIAGALNVRSNERVTLETLLGGFRYVWNNSVVLAAVSIDLMAVLLGGVMGLLPIYASDILHVGPEGLGVMRAMPGAGSLLIGLVLTRLTFDRYLGPALFVSLAVFGTSIVVFSLSELFWLSLLALAIYGAADMVSVYIRLTVVQIATPDSMRGRVSAVNSVSINASNELGDFRAGLMAAAVGAVPAVLAGGIATLGVTVLWARMFPAMRRVDRLRDVSARLA